MTSPILPRFAVLFLTAWGTPLTAADVDVEALGSYVFGTLQTPGVLKTRGYAATLDLKVEGLRSGLCPCSFGATLHRQDLSYKDEGAQFVGTDLLEGATLGARVFKLEPAFLRLEAAYYPRSDMIVTSESEGAVNGQSFKHSTLHKFIGVGAFEGRASYIVEVTGKQYNRHERIRYGFSASYLKQTITQMDTLVAVSNPNLSPASRVSTSVSGSYSSIGFGVLLGYAF